MNQPISAAPVLVKGASGFRATHIVEQLLAKGYAVRGTVRDVVPVPVPVGYLTPLLGSENLKLVEADLLTDGALDELLRGCECVIHTASPYIITVKDPQRDLLEPAVNRTLFILKSCSDSQTVRRIVVTSPIAAVTDEPDNRVLTEAD